MAYYDALKTQWATLTGTTAQKLAAINAMTVAGPNVDVTVSTVVGELMLSGAFLTLDAFSQTIADSNTTRTAALNSAKLLMALVTTPNAPNFVMSDPTKFAITKALLDAILAEETATPGSTGVTQTVHDALLALCSTTIPWWRANGYTSPFTQADLDAAGGLA